MLLGLAGVSGVGKSYYTNLITEKLGFSRVHTLTTRAPRTGDVKGDKIYVTEPELIRLRQSGAIGFELELLGNKYAYLKEDLELENVVVEVHYSTISDLKHLYPHMKSIYLFPHDLDHAKDCIRQRDLSPEVEAARIAEAEEHFALINSDQNLRNLFDYHLYNNYDTQSERELLDLVRKIMTK